ncbi:oligosaccharide flippase family protein [Paraburkholderia phosphatilytica]|uniref:oligosaccharide flippase family protein n=1 Tax=Paraburkholderia phosphatilytica TaxID=2282883 RepID=UPI0013E066A0|nr:oligosaccharide flippase family protein [Paraburkholderia phosphatilytica]
MKNAGLTLAGTLVPIGISLVTVPGYLSALGAQRYGMMNLVWTVIGYFGVLDLGISLATENRISIACAAEHDSDAHADRQGHDRAHAQLEEVFFSAVCMNFITGVIGAVLLLGGALVYLTWFAHLSPGFSHEIYASLPWLAIAIPLANITWVFAGSLTGADRFGVFNLNQVLGMASFQCVPLLAAHFISPTLPVVIGAAVITRVLSGIVLWISTRRSLGLSRWHTPSVAIVRQLFSFGAWVVIGGAAEALATSLDRLFIGGMMGAREVAYYATPQNLVSRLAVLPTAVMRSLFPRLSASSRSDAHALTRQGIALVAGVLTPATIVAICVLHPFLAWWVGNDLATAGVAAGRVLALAVWVGSTASVVRVLLQAQADPGRAARISMIQLPLLALMLWLGLSTLGLVGAALAVLCRSLVDGALLVRSAKLGGRTLLGVLLPHAACLGVAMLLADALSGFLELAAAALVMAAVNLGITLALSAPLRAFVRELPALAMRRTRVQTGDRMV